MAGKGTNSTVKQLGVIGLDANGNEISRTYYVVSPSFTTGHRFLLPRQFRLQRVPELSVPYEEALNGGYDNNYTNYWLYINEANEGNFQGKMLS